MSSRYYRPLVEDANDPRYDEASPFDGGPEPYDTPQESPFAPPPSVNESKATKPAERKASPFDEVDPRIKALDDQIASRPRSIGGIIAGFSPHGDRTMANLMLQRKMYGDEAHGDQQLKRQLESSRMLQESAFRRADAQEKAAQERAKAGMYGADQRLTGTEYRADKGLEGTQYRADKGLEGTQYRADKGLEGTEYKTDNQRFRPQADRNAHAAGKAPVNPQVPVLQAEMKQINKVLNDPNVVLSDEQRLEYLRKYNMAKRKIEQMSGQPAPAPSAAPSTAPAVKDTKATVRPSATGPNGEKIEWDGTAWVPAS